MPESEVNWGDFAGKSIIGKGIDTAFGLFGNFIGNKWAQEREDEARRQNYEYGEKSAQNADARYRALIEDYGTPSAQLRMLQEAGLSPSLFFGEGASAPQPSAGAQGTGSGAISPTSFGSLSTESFGNTMLTLAKAREANAEANRIEGKNERGKNEIEKLSGEVEYQYLSNEAVTWDNTSRALNVNLLASYGEEEIKAKIKEYVESANLLHQQAREQKVKGNISEKTEEAIIKTIETDLRQKIANVSLTRAMKKLTDAQQHLTEEQARTVIRTVMDNHHAVMLKDEEVYINYRIANKTIDVKLKELGITEEKMRWEISRILFDEIVGTGSMIDNGRSRPIGFR